MVGSWSKSALCLYITYIKLSSRLKTAGGVLLLRTLEAKPEEARLLRFTGHGPSLHIVQHDSYVIT